MSGRLAAWRYHSSCAGERPAGQAATRVGHDARNGASSHDDISPVIPTTRARGPGRSIRVLLAILFLLPLLSGIAGAPIAHGDDLSDAIAQQKALAAKIAADKSQAAELAALQADLKASLASTQSKLQGINADLASVKKNIAALTVKVNAVRAAYDAQVARLADLDAQLLSIQVQEDQKAVQLAQRKALLADRVRAAYDSDRTSLLETILSADSFSDVLGDVGYFIDIGTQDKALAQQIARDQQTLAALHQTTLQTRVETDALRADTLAKKADLDASMATLKAAQAQMVALQKATAKALAIQKAAWSRAYTNAAAMRKAISAEQAAEAAIKQKIDAIIASNGGGIPSDYSGQLIWPLAGPGITVTQEFGCTGMTWEPPFGSCDHYHNGIDLATDGQVGIPIKAAGDGKVVYAGALNDGAWVVVIAHSQHLRTWYGHVQTNIPVHAGQYVSAGDVIAYVGMTGHTTGPHLHWMVESDGTFVNPRLFV